MTKLKISKKLVLNIICILTGICAFISVNIAYAMSKVQEFISRLGLILIVIPGVFIIVFIILVGLLSRWSMKKETRIKDVLKYVSIAVFSGWVIVVGCVHFFSEEVLYTNSPVRQDLINKIQSQDNYEEISIKVEPGITLQGFLYKESSQGKTPLAIYFGGRGEEASSIIEYAEKVKGYSLAFINYRGCGLSNGRQSREKVLSDSLAIYDYFASKSSIDKDNIVLIAHSLGTGVAINLASQRNVKGIALSAAYDEYTGGVIQDKIPLIPVKMLISDEFDSLAIAPKLKIPALFLIAEKDRTIVRSRTMKLLNSWGWKAEAVIIKNAHHENITINNYTWERINEFMEGLIKP